MLGSASYVILHSKICGKKLEVCQFGSRKSFWLNIITKFVVVVEEIIATMCTKECYKYHLTIV
jgi:hypothetical protein